MIKTTLSLCCISVLWYGTAAQNAKTIVVKSGDDVRESISTDMYRYPRFIMGKVFFRDGDSTRARLNYNLVAGDMQYINANADTVSIANSKSIRCVKIEEDSFFYDKGYIEQIGGGDLVKLGVMQVIKLKDIKKTGAYGQPSNGTIESYGTYSGSHQVQKLKVNEDLVLSKKTDYYFGDKFNHFVPANKKHMLQMFSKREREIEKYLEANTVNFNKHEDLEKLTVFLQSL